MLYYEIQNIYLEHISVADLETKLKADVEEYYFILHDKDTFIDASNNEVTEKKAHYHIIIGTTENSRTAKNTLTKYFEKISPKCRVNNIKVLSRFMRYLRHQDNKDKYQYQLEAVHTNNFECYSEATQNVLKEMTDTDKMLEAFYQWCIDAYCEVPLTFMDILNWFRTNNSLSYFIQHQKQLLDMASNIYQSLASVGSAFDDMEAIDKIQDRMGGIN